MGKTTYQILKGTRDFLPAQFISRKRVIRVIEETFELFGFEPMETPAMEYAETLEEKYGEEGERLMYKFIDRGDRRVALRYDLTVPLARTMAMYPVEKPFRRYQISPVWRADKPQKGRFREFWQCDADIIGSGEMWADAEIIAVTYSALTRLGFKRFSIRINNRKLLNGIARYGGVTDQAMAGFFRIIDKVDKVGWDGVRKELETKEFSSSVINATLDLLLRKEKVENVLPLLEDMLRDIPIAVEGILELQEMERCLIGLGVPRSYFVFDIALARGLDYYTGPIYETVVEEPRIGSISGGGRYDGLIGMFSGQPMPATGGSLGLERIVAAMEELGMLPATPTLSQVLVTVFDRSLVETSMQVVAELRREDLNAEVFVSDEKLKKQLTYANKKGIPLVVIVGPDERGQGVVTLKDMRSNEQITAPRATLGTMIKERLSNL